MAESRAEPRRLHSAVPSPLKYVFQNVSIACITESGSPSVDVLMTCRRRLRSRSSLKSSPWMVDLVFELNVRATIGVRTARATMAEPNTARPNISRVLLSQEKEEPSVYGASP